jgi:hypothetical protein
VAPACYSFNADRVACKAWIVVHSIENYVWTKTMDLNGVVNERNDVGTCNGVVISVFFLCAPSGGKLT